MGRLQFGTRRNKFSGNLGRRRVPYAPVHRRHKEQIRPHVVERPARQYLIVVARLVL